MTRSSVGPGGTAAEGGAYGFRLVFDASPAPSDGLIAPVPGAEEVAVRHVRASSMVDREEVGADAVLLGARGKGLLDVRRAPGSITIAVPDDISPEALVHPLMTLPVALLAAWRGRGTLHGGAFLHEGRAWVLTGEQTAGKSSTLATLGEMGVPVLADDLVVIDGDELLAGPDRVDLRPDAATRFPAATSIGVVAGRERFRLATPAAPPSVPFGGIVVLEWADDPVPHLVELEAKERLRLLHAQHYAALLGPPDPFATMGMLSRPMWRLRRRRAWDGVEAAVVALLDGVAAAT